MPRVWKWVLGIWAVLVTAALVVTIVWAVQMSGRAAVLRSSMIEDHDLQNAEIVGLWQRVCILEGQACTPSVPQPGTWPPDELPGWP